MFHRFRRSPPLFLPVPPLLVALFGYLVTRNMAEWEWLPVAESITRGLLTTTFLLAAGAIAILLLITVAAGRIKLEDVGLNRDYIGRGIGVIAMIWVASQVVGVLPRVVANRPVLLDRAFEYGSRLEMGGAFLSALGTATLEEIALRGFLLVQLSLLFHRGRSEAAGLGWATGLTVLISSLVALPRTLPYPSLEVAAVDQAFLLGGSLFLSWLYLRTRNLFFVIGVHALLVAPSPVVAGPGSGGAWYQALVVAILATVWALLWPRRD